jgi:cytosine/adenosine deaminase-related metal-dependent hydrolase
MDRIVLDGCAVVTMDAHRTEYASGHVIVDRNHIEAVGDGRAPQDHADARYVDASGCLATPGFVNTHHHLYQWVTRGLAADDTLFGWLTTLYPVWAGIDAEMVGTAARGALVWLARTGCTTTTDHHYVFPRSGGDVFASEVAAAAEVGLRFHPTRGSMDLGRSKGGLPPDSVVEDTDEILVATEAAIDRFHDPSAESMLRVAVAPCSPFSVTSDLMKEAAALARRKGVRMHTHLAETLDEENFCREHFGCSPVDYVEDLGWLGDDVWLAHAIHLDDDAVAKVARTGTGVAHCPTSNARLGAGICRTRDLRNAGAKVGLGVDGAASNEACSLLEEVRHALLFARARGGPQALTVRDALEMATLGGARVLGREAEIGSLESGKLADIALWRLDTLAHIDIADPVAALVLGSPPPLKLLMVNGRPIVEDDRILTLDESDLAREVAAASRTLLRKTEAPSQSSAKKSILTKSASYPRVTGRFRQDQREGGCAR